MMSPPVLAGFPRIYQCFLVARQRKSISEIFRSTHNDLSFIKTQIEEQVDKTKKVTNNFHRFCNWT